MNNDIRKQLCKDDFYHMMGNSIVESGGKFDIEQLKKMTLQDFAHAFATNGIRLAYMPEKHMNSIKITWEATKPDNTPKKKQLLCDQMDKGDEGYGWAGPTSRVG
jgi:hypothetical protein